MTLFEPNRRQGGRKPDQAQIIAAFEGLGFETPRSKKDMRLGKGHQGVQGTAYGMIKHVDGQTAIANATRYSADEVNPPEGVRSEEWIRSGLAR